ncbi:hypothetical protein [Falsibacillus albus]|uniref:Uncharacterized protein n=1 Tax=Falsibacillus albus TaxID=2478915 RepID=A0A3L7JV06_9BACI|nr:hypothetical protein [Falsibacillus albus]RLQ94623.1 hypothetical protein D9X91_13900 [Falsibacillus albus]
MKWNKKFVITLSIIFLVGGVFIFQSWNPSTPAEALKKKIPSLGSSLYEEKSENQDFAIYTSSSSQRQVVTAFLEKNIFSAWKIRNITRTDIQERNTGSWSTYHDMNQNQYTAIGIIDPDVKKVIFPNNKSAQIINIPDSKSRIWIYTYDKNDLDGSFTPEFIN